MRIISELEAVKQAWDIIKYINNPSEAVQLEAVKQNGYAIEYINNPSEAVQLEAVKQNGDVIKYINNPSEAVQLEAVKHGGDVIKYINNPSEAVQLEAVKNYYPICVLGDTIKVGCRVYTKQEWLNFTEEEIDDMDGQKALDFYPYLVEFIRGLD